MNKKIKYTRNLILVLLFVIIGLEFILPYTAEREIKNLIKSNTDSVEDIRIKVSSFPALKILAGHIDHVELDTKDIVINGLNLSELDVHYRDVKLHEDGFSGVNIYLNSVIREKALQQYLIDNYSGFENFFVVLNPDQLILEGTYNIFNQPVFLKIAGNFRITEEKIVHFSPGDFQIEEFNIPVSIVKSYLEQMGFKIDLHSLSIPLDIQTIEIMSEKVVITGGYNREGENIQ